MKRSLVFNLCEFRVQSFHSRTCKNLLLQLIQVFDNLPLIISEVVEHQEKNNLV